MPRLILGTAGHIDHGKTALVKTLTGIDTDRLKEEKERGITVDLGFAELEAPGGYHYGVVDVPGHEGFIRNMLAGATGVDLVLLVVAADEGVMPQTREHLAIVRLLGVPRLLVALTKADLVEEEWLELAIDEVMEVLEANGYPDAGVIPVSAVTKRGIEELMEALGQLGAEIGEKSQADLARLPIDRVFTIKGAGTIVTGTLWTGRLQTGKKLKILPGTLEARVRSLQLHGKEVEEAPPGSRVAVGLTGSGITHQALVRGQTLVEGEGWESSWMVTTHLSILPDTGWSLEQGQRVRVHLGTAEALARVVILEGEILAGGEEGWVQLRLEESILARTGDHLVIRSYSPVTTIGGGRVAEVSPGKKRFLAEGEGTHLEARLATDPIEALVSLLETAGWSGVSHKSLPHRLGFAPEQVDRAMDSMIERKTGVVIDGHLFGQAVWNEARALFMDNISGFHEAEPLRPGMSLEELRQALPPTAGAGLGDAVIRKLVAWEELTLFGGLVRLSEYAPELTPAQRNIRAHLCQILEEEGLSPPSVKDLAERVSSTQAATEGILRLLEVQKEVVSMEGGLFFWAEAIDEAGTNVISALGGQTELGPADFREVLGVTRKFLLPLLRYFDTTGITTRVKENRRVADTIPGV